MEQTKSKLKLPQKIMARQHEITADFLKEVDKHLLDIVEGRVMDMFEIKDLAELMNIHPTHLSNTIKLTTGKAPCYFFEDKILTIAKGLLEQNEMSINQIATLLTYDPSNFTKFFKRFSGQTPKQYREDYLLEKYHQKTETDTI
jgi:AraC family transcriptional regulator, regulatory protein of adaptative response / methylphosphotriester-DNA alkyltransferase methyltransferase